MAGTFNPADIRAGIEAGFAAQPHAYVLSAVRVEGTPASGRVLVDIRGQDLVPEAIDSTIADLGYHLENAGMVGAYASESDRHIQYVWVRASHRARAHMRRVY